MILVTLGWDFLVRQDNGETSTRSSRLAVNHQLLGEKGEKSNFSKSFSQVDKDHSKLGQNWFGKTSHTESPSTPSIQGRIQDSRAPRLPISAGPLLTPPITIIHFTHHCLFFKFFFEACRALVFCQHWGSNFLLVQGALVFVQGP